MTLPPRRKSDPYHCNKCALPLGTDGICRRYHPPPAELFTATVSPPSPWCGGTHAGKLAAPVGPVRQQERP